MNRRLALALFLATSAAAAQQTLPAGHFRLQLSQVYAQQTLPSFEVPHLLDETTAAALLHSQGKALFGDLSPHDLSLLSPGMSFSGEGYVTATVAQIDYGVTDWLTLSAIAPWYEVARTLPKVTAAGALIGYNLDYNPRAPITPANLPFTVPGAFVTGLPGRAVAGTEGAQRIFTNLLGYHRAERFDAYGIGDPYAAVTVAFARNSKLRGAATVYAQIPLGRRSDPDDPFAVSFGDGHTALGSRVSIEDREGLPVVIVLGARSLVPLRDHPVLRIYSSGLVPLAGAGAKERVSRRAGPQFGAFAGISRSLAGGLLRPSLTLGFDRRLADHLSGLQSPANYAAMEDNSRFGQFSSELAIAYTTVEQFLAGHALFPGEISLSWYYQVQDHGLFAGLPQHRLWLTFSTFY